MKFNMFPGMLNDGGPSHGRLLNISVGIFLSIIMVKLAWKVDDIKDLNLWFWAVFTTYACYGMGSANFSKWLEIIRIRAGGQPAPEERANPPAPAAAPTDKPKEE